MSKKRWEVGDLIAAARQRSGLGQKEAAQRSGVSYAWFRALEQGHHWRAGKKIPAKPTAELVVRIADALGTDPNPILAAAGLPELRQAPEIRNEINKLLDRLSTAEVFSVHGFIEGVIASRSTSTLESQKSL